MEEIPYVVCNRDSFLSSDPETWATNEAYLESEAVVKELHVVSDTAEPWCKSIVHFVRKMKNKCSLPCK